MHHFFASSWFDAVLSIAVDRLASLYGFNVSPSVFLLLMSLCIFVYIVKNVIFSFFCFLFWFFYFGFFCFVSSLLLLALIHYQALLHKWLFYVFLKAFYCSSFFDSLETELVVVSGIIENAVLCLLCNFLALCFQLPFYRSCFWQILEFFFILTVVCPLVQGLFCILLGFFLCLLIRN